MSDLAALAFALIFICTAVFFVARMYNQHVRAASLVAKVRWEIEEHGSGDEYRIVVVRPGTSEYCRGWTIPCSAPDFDIRLEEARVEAQMQMQAMNRGLPR